MTRSLIQRPIAGASNLPSAGRGLRGHWLAPAGIAPAARRRPRSLRFTLVLIYLTASAGDQGPRECAEFHARRYRRTATGAKTAISSADQARARTTSVLPPRISERTALTMGVIGW